MGGKTPRETYFNTDVARKRNAASPGYVSQPTSLPAVDPLKSVSNPFSMYDTFGSSFSSSDFTGGGGSFGGGGASGDF